MDIRKRKPGEVFIDLQGKIVVTFNGLKMKNVDIGEITDLKGVINKKLITDLQTADSTIRTSPDNHVAYSNKARCLTELAAGIKNDEYYGLAILHYEKAITLVEDAGDFIQQATYYSRKANLMLKLGDVVSAVNDSAAAKAIISKESPSNDAEKISVRYVKGNILNIIKLQYVRKKIDALSREGVLSNETKSMLLEEYQAFTDALAAGNDGNYQVKLQALEQRLGSVEERQAFHEYDINMLKDDKANVEDTLDKIQTLISSGDSVDTVQAGRYIDYLSKFPSMEKIVEMVTGLLKGQEQKIEANVYLHVNAEITKVKGELSNQIGDVSLRVDTLETKFSELNDLGQRLEQIYTEINSLQHANSNSNNEQFNLRLTELERSKQELEVKIGSIVSTLEITGITEQAELSEKIEALRIRDKDLHKYFTTLYFQLEGYFYVYQELGTGLLSGNSIDDLKESKLSNIKWFASLLGNAGLEMLKATVDNYCYSALSAVYSIRDSVDSIKQKVEVDNQVTRIQQVIKNKFSNDGELNKNEIVKLALKLTSIREEQLETTGNPSEEKNQDGLLNKFDGLLGQVKDKITGKLLERYQSGEEKLAAHDALMLLGFICGRYQKLSSMNTPMSEFFNDWTLRELEISNQIKDTLEQIKQSAAKGKWEEARGKDLKIHKNIESRLDDSYLKEKLGHLYSKENVKVAKILYFGVINAEIANSKKIDSEFIEKCIHGFNKTNHGLVEKIAREHPEYFINKEIAGCYIKDNDLLLTEVKQKMVTQIYMLNEIIFDNPLFNHEEFMKSLVTQFGTEEAMFIMDLAGGHFEQLEDLG